MAIEAIAFVGKEDTQQNTAERAWCRCRCERQRALRCASASVLDMQEGHRRLLA